MNIVVPVLMVPDLVEELLVDSSGARLDIDYLRWILNEFDDHAIEQAILLKERTGARVTVIAPEFDGTDDVLFTAAAKGADRLIKLMGDFSQGVNNHALARILAPVIENIKPDLLLTGVQTHESIDGAIGPILAQQLDIPYIGYVAGVVIENGNAVVRKEYPGSLIARMEVTLPAVLGVQAADTPPRYVPISKTRQAMKTSQIEEVDAGAFDLTGEVPVERLYPPEVAEMATMIEGNTE